MSYLSDLRRLKELFDGAKPETDGELNAKLNMLYMRYEMNKKKIILLNEQENDYPYLVQDVVKILCEYMSVIQVKKGNLRYTDHNSYMGAALCSWYEYISINPLKLSLAQIRKYTQIHLKMLAIVYKTYIRPYEDIKRKENGDFYKEVLTWLKEEKEK